MPGVKRTGEQSITISSSAFKGAERKRSTLDNFGQAELKLTTVGATTKADNPTTDNEWFDTRFASPCREVGELTAKMPAAFIREYYVPYLC